MSDSLGLKELAALLDLTEKHIADPDPPRAARAEGAAMEILEILARVLGDDPHGHLSALIVACGETLGRASTSPADLQAGAQALGKGAFSRSLTAALRKRIAELES